MGDVQNMIRFIVVANLIQVSDFLTLYRKQIRHLTSNEEDFYEQTKTFKYEIDLNNTWLNFMESASNGDRFSMTSKQALM